MEITIEQSEAVGTESLCAKSLTMPSNTHVISGIFSEPPVEHACEFWSAL
jgi:hypothetical protein